VVLRFLCDFSTEEPASVLGIAPGTVTAHVHRSVATLRAALADPEREVHRG
jgi:DNA-directed RNA polymerase specialized sigma24 family protein